MSEDQQSNPSEPIWTPEKVAAVEAEAVAAIKRMSDPAVIPRTNLVPRAFEQAYGDCETHGPYPQNILDDKGVERWLSPVCPACEKQAKVRQLMERAAISPRFEFCEFSNFRAEKPEQQVALATCKEYAANFKNYLLSGVCLILRGNPGTGKNHLATAISKSVMQHGYSALNATAFEIIQRIRATWSPTSAEMEEWVIKEFSKIDLLVIDEVGRQYKSKDGSDSIEIFNVIDARYRLVKPTVIISNQDREGLKTYLGEASFDRLRQGGGKLANFDWQSARS